MNDDDVLGNAQRLGFSQKDKKYDRQLRLWQAHGQQALENASICILSASATATETLKNLVLPGIGAFTVVDGNNVEQADLGNNFFVQSADLGKARAKSVTDSLLELNNLVNGSHFNEQPKIVIESKTAEFFKSFTMVVTVNLCEKSLLKLAAFLEPNNIPLVVVWTYGFIGYVRISVGEHTIVETHPDAIVDLRLDAPFKSLLDFTNSVDFSKLDSMGLSHTPYVVLLLKCLDEFKRLNHHLPSNTEEKAQFKSMIRSLMTPDLKEPENFEEALAATYRVFTPTKLASETLKILSDPKCENLNAKSSSFWIISRALRDFIQNEGHGLPPVAGTLPDMKADTESYVALQTIYREKARQDVALVYARVHALLVLYEIPEDKISLEQVERFCKNSQNLKLIRYKSIKEEYTSMVENPQLKSLLQDLDNNAVWYVLLRATDRFYEIHFRYPGVHDSEVEKDIQLLKKCVVFLLSKWGIPTDAVPDDHIHEMVRAGACEMHNMAALQGGIVSQEIIKLITGQYVPLDNTLIFNGMRSTSFSFSL